MRHGRLDARLYSIVPCVVLTAVLVFAGTASAGPASGEDSCAAAGDAGDRWDAATGLEPPVSCLGSLLRTDADDREDWYRVAAPFPDDGDGPGGKVCVLNADGSATLEIVFNDAIHEALGQPPAPHPNPIHVQPGCRHFDTGAYGPLVIVGGAWYLVVRAGTATDYSLDLR